MVSGAAPVSLTGSAPGSSGSTSSGQVGAVAVVVGGGGPVVVDAGVAVGTVDETGGSPVLASTSEPVAVSEPHPVNPHNIAVQHRMTSRRNAPTTGPGYRELPGTLTAW